MGRRGRRSEGADSLPLQWNSRHAELRFSNVWQPCVATFRAVTATNAATFCLFSPPFSPRFLPQQYFASQARGAYLNFIILIIFGIFRDYVYAYRFDLDSLLNVREW